MYEHLADLAREQGGAWTRQDALQSGLAAAVIARRARDGEWLRHLPRTFVPTTVPLSRDLQRRAAVLWAGRPCALSHLDAAAVWRLPGLAELDERAGDRPIDLLVPSDRHPRSRPGVRVRRSDPARFVAVERDGLPVVPLDVSVRTLAELVPDTVVRAVVRGVLLERRTTLARLRATLGRGLSGSAALRDALDLVDPDLQSHWEGVLYRALAAAGEPGVPQVRVVLRNGRRVVYVDRAWPELGLVVEVDGFLVHMAAFVSDRRRGNRLVLDARAAVLHYTPDDLKDQLADVVREIVDEVRLRRRGRRVA